MRELEFLPGWYPNLRRKRRILLVEAWLAVVIVATLGLWMILSARNVMAKESVLSNKQIELKQSNEELEQLAELKQLQQRMSNQALLMSRLGPDVPMGRLMETIEQLLPPRMALLDVSVQFPEVAQVQITRPGPAARGPDRQLVVQLHGVAPSDVEIGTFMMNISKIPNYEGSPDKMLLTDVHENGHLMRDFQISFSIRLGEEDN